MGYEAEPRNQCLLWDLPTGKMFTAAGFQRVGRKGGLEAYSTIRAAVVVDRNVAGNHLHAASSPATMPELGAFQK